MRVIDLDNHLVDDLPSWERWIEPAWRDQLPRALPTAPTERPRTQVGSRVMIGSEIPVQRSQRPNWVGTTDHSPGGRLRLLDDAGIDVAVLSPSSSAQNFVWFAAEPDLAGAYCRAQNAYMIDYAAHAPARFKWAGVIPLQEPRAAVEELRRIGAEGSVAVNVKAVPIDGREWFDPYYNPVYAELERLGLPLILHDTKTGSLGEERFAESWFLSHLVGKVLEALVCCAALVCGGVLERFPGLKIVVVETDTAQWPWWLARMDEHFERLPHMVPILKMAPSDYFRRQVYLACEPALDRLFDRSVELLGDRNLVLGTDTPHWDAAAPADAIRPILESRLSPESKERILGTNAATLLRLEDER